MACCVDIIYAILHLEFRFHRVSAILRCCRAIKPFMFSARNQDSSESYVIVAAFGQYHFSGQSLVTTRNFD